MTAYNKFIALSTNFPDSPAEIANENESKKKQ
jgi:hypothetical protein